MENSQRKGLNRNTIDKYYTKSSTVDLCIKYIKKNIKIDYLDDLIIEPSAGNGSFIPRIKELSQHTLFFDISPEHPEIRQQNYLETDWSEERTNQYDRKIHVIGNPPFGRQSSMAIQFIKKSTSFCNTISFILPKSFKKDSLKRYFPSYFHLIFETDLPEKSFLVDGEEHNVESVFQIWEKKTFERPFMEKLEPVNFLFVDKTEDPDFSFRRVGVYAGKIDNNIFDKSIQSHYFIKLTQIQNPEQKHRMIENLKKIEFSHNNTVGPRSISKQEIIKAFTPVIFENNSEEKGKKPSLRIIVPNETNEE